MKHLIHSLLILLLTSTFVHSQNTISVPFPNGFIGISDGNNSAVSCYYLSGIQGLGWTDVQFSQTTNGSVFTAQGNDIIGEVLITDYLGVSHQIPGFIKWRTPSGNNPHTMVFQPAPGTFTLATNGFNGSSSYTIDENKYIGLTKQGSTLTINPVPGTVTGNASTSGLLDALNATLGELPHLEIIGTIVEEPDGTAQVTVNLSAASTYSVDVHFNTYSSTALAVDDYDSTTLVLTFLPGEIQKLVNIPITVDAVNENTEFFLVRLSESKNAAITTSQDSVTILEATLPVTFIGFNVVCESSGYRLKWSTASEHNSDRFDIERSEDGLTWSNIGSQPAQGFSNQTTNYEFRDFQHCLQCQSYYRIKQLDLDGQFKYSPILTADCSKNETFVSLSPNPTHEKVNLSINLNRNDYIDVAITDLSGATVQYQEMNGQQGNNVFEIDVSQLESSYYLILIKTSTEAFTERLQIAH